MHQKSNASMTYIWVSTAATSVQTVSMSSLRVCSAKTLSSGSSSVRKARTPVAETIPGILRGCEESGAKEVYSERYEGMSWIVIVELGGR